MNVSKRHRQRSLLPATSHETASSLSAGPAAETVRGLIKKIVSGGQTGVDRGALDAAIQLGVQHGGWCPQGRWAEDGRIPARYELVECAERDYRVRTEKNVVDSDGTLILYRGPLSGGTRLTRQFARRLAKPYFLVDFDDGQPVIEVRLWLVKHKIMQLNVAGPRESSRPGVSGEAKQFLVTLLAQNQADGP